MDWMARRWLQIAQVKPRLVSCRMISDLALPVSGKTYRAWYVFEADFGGEIFLTIPVDLVPGWVGRRRLRRLLRILNAGTWGKSTEEGCQVRIVEDHLQQPYSVRPEEWKEFRQYNYTSLVQTGVEIPDAMFEEGSEELETRLSHWKAVGYISGGMGGGYLLNEDVWFHYELLYRGLPLINEVRRLLGFQKLDTLEVQMSDGDRRHMELIVAALD